MKKLLVTMLALVMLFGVMITGCAAPAAQAPAAAPAAEAPAAEAPAAEAPAADEQLTFGFLFCGLDTPSVKAGQEAAMARAEELGINLLVMDGEFDTQKQTDQALNLISQQVDGIIVNPNDAEAFVPAAKQIYDAGIPLLSWVQPLPEAADEFVVSFIGPDDTAAGQAAMDAIRAEFEGQTEPIKVVEIQGALGSIATQKRAQGLQDALASSDDFELLETQATETWARDEAMVIMENYLTKYDNIQCVYCHDDNMAQGAIEAIKKAGRLDEVKVIGINGEPAAFTSIEAGEQFATLVQHIRWGAAECMDVLVGINEGKTYDAWIVDEWEVVTSENIANSEPAWD